MCSQTQPPAKLHQMTSTEIQKCELEAKPCTSLGTYPLIVSHAEIHNTHTYTVSKATDTHTSRYTNVNRGSQSLSLAVALTHKGSPHDLALTQEIPDVHTVTGRVTHLQSHPFTLPHTQFLLSAWRFAPVLIT